MASVHSRWVNGNLVFYDTYFYRWLKALGPDVALLDEHFVNTPFASADNLAAATTTLVEGGGGETTVALAGGATTGALLITTDAAENDGANIQWNGEAFKLVSGKPMYFGCKLQASEATQSDFFVGLSITATDVLGGVSDSIGFRKVDASTTVNALLEKNTTETESAAHTLVAATDVTLEMFFDGDGHVDFYVNGTAITRPAMTNLPDDEYLSPAIHFLAGSANVRTMTVDWIRCIQLNS